MKLSQPMCSHEEQGLVTQVASQKEKKRKRGKIGAVNVVESYEEWRAAEKMSEESGDAVKEPKTRRVWIWSVAWWSDVG
jgi:hypothetical protein